MELVTLPCGHSLITSHVEYRCNVCDAEESLPRKVRVYVKPDGKVARRPIKEQSYMVHALEMAKQVTCDRLQVGCVLTDPDMTRVLCAGYNGSWAKGPNGCVSTVAGNCGCCHAEVNALTKSRDDLRGCVCFVTTAPCRNCAVLLVNRGVSRVVYLNDYRLRDGLDVLEAARVEVASYASLPSDS